MTFDDYQNLVVRYASFKITFKWDNLQTFLSVVAENHVNDTASDTAVTFKMGQSANYFVSCRGTSRH